jgi:hypothetical protein
MNSFSFPIQRFGSVGSFFSRWAGGRVVLVRGPSCRRARVGAGFDFLFFPCLLVGLLVFSRGGGGGLGGAGIFFAGENFFLVLYTPHLRPYQRIY